MASRCALSITNRPGMLGRVATAIGDAGGDIGAVDLVESTRERIVRDITINSRDSDHGQQIQPAQAAGRRAGRQHLRPHVPHAWRPAARIIQTR